MIKNRLLRKTLRFILKKPLVGLARLHLTKVEYPLDIHSTTNSLKILHAYELLDNKYVAELIHRTPAIVKGTMLSIIVQVRNKDVEEPIKDLDDPMKLVP